jgi:hypothetical protein
VSYRHDDEGPDDMPGRHQGAYKGAYQGRPWNALTQQAVPMVEWGSGWSVVWKSGMSVGRADGLGVMVAGSKVEREPIAGLLTRVLSPTPPVCSSRQGKYQVSAMGCGERTLHHTTPTAIRRPNASAGDCRHLLLLLSLPFVIAFCHCLLSLPSVISCPAGLPDGDDVGHPGAAWQAGAGHVAGYIPE